MNVHRKIAVNETFSDQCEGLTGPLAKKGKLTARLAQNAEEVTAAQQLRYEVFFKEMSAIGGGKSSIHKRDIDEYDSYCDHLLVINEEPVPGGNGILLDDGELVGTYRLMRQENAQKAGGFYSAQEFDISPLLETHRELRFLELGRSCVRVDFRNKQAIELLWHGIGSYVSSHDIDVMIGCASLSGVDPDQLALQLSFLHHHAEPSEDWHVAAVPSRFTDMNKMPAGEICMKSAIKALPPLIKGYLRLGAWIGRGAVIDNQFQTIDVFIILPMSRIDRRYFNKFGATAGQGPTEAAVTR